MSKNNNYGISGKGYYIALILCALAIGITGYLYYRNTETDQLLQNPTVAADATQPGSDVQAVAPKDEQPQPTQTAPAPQKPTTTTRPVSGETVSDYSMDALTYNQTTRDWRVHDGMDIAAEAGTEVCAAADGTVYTVYEDETMGMTVVLTHVGGYTTKYSSLSQEVPVAAGDTVTAGQVIGYVGNSALFESAIGDHVHFSVSCGGDLVDPESFLE